MSAAELELAPGETVRWSGGPQRLPWFVPADLLLVPFTFVWTGGAV